MIRKSVILILLIFFTIITYECCIPCSSYEREHYCLLSDLEIINKVFADKDYFSGFIEEEVIDNKIDSNKYFAIQLNFVDSITKTINLSAIYNGLILKTYACPESWDFYIYKNKIDSIKIYTLNDFDSLHMANSEITEYFYYLVCSYCDSLCSVSNDLSNFINGDFETKIQLISESDYNMLLTTKPILTDSLKFKVFVYLNDSSVFIRETKSVLQL